MGRRLLDEGDFGGGVRGVSEECQTFLATGLLLLFWLQLTGELLAGDIVSFFLGDPTGVIN